MRTRIPEEDKLKAEAIYSIRALRSLIALTLKDNIPLIEAFWLALSLHVLLLPVFWCAGWALPWPKTPSVTSVIEIDLSDWPRAAKSKKLFEFRDPKRN